MIGYVRGVRLLVILVLLTVRTHLYAFLHHSGSCRAGACTRWTLEASKAPPPLRTPPTTTTVNGNKNATSAFASVAGISMYRPEFVQPFSLNSTFISSLNSTTVRLLFQFTDEVSSLWAKMEQRMVGFRLIVSAKVEADLRAVGLARSFASQKVSKDLGRFADDIGTISKPIMSLPANLQQNLQQPEEALRMLQAGINPLVDKQPKLMGNFDATSTKQRAKLKKKAPQFEKPPNSLAPDALYRSVKTLPSTLKYDYERRVRKRESEAEGAAEIDRQLSNGSFADATVEPKILSPGINTNTNTYTDAHVVGETVEIADESLEGEDHVTNGFNMLVPINSAKIAAIKMIVSFSETRRLDNITTELQWASGLMQEFSLAKEMSVKTTDLSSAAELDDNDRLDANDRKIVLAEWAEACEASARLGKVPAQLLILQQFQGDYKQFGTSSAIADSRQIPPASLLRAVQVLPRDIEVIGAGLISLVEELSKAAPWVTPAVEERLRGQKQAILESFLELEVLKQCLADAQTTQPTVDFRSLINPSAYEDDDEDDEVIKEAADTDEVVRRTKSKAEQPALVFDARTDDLHGISLGSRALQLASELAAEAEAAEMMARASASAINSTVILDTTAQSVMTDEEKLSRFALTALDVLFFLGETAVKAAGPILVDGGALASSRVQETLFPDTGGSTQTLLTSQKTSLSFKKDDKGVGEGSGRVEGRGQGSKLLSSLQIQRKRGV